MEQMKEAKHLSVALKRAQAAYELYSKKKRYVDALRIKNSNLKIYKLLEDYSILCQEEIQMDVFQFIFHLDDWFQQFYEKEQAEKPKLKDKFIFERLEHSPSFPKNFINLIDN